MLRNLQGHILSCRYFYNIVSIHESIKATFHRRNGRASGTTHRNSTGNAPSFGHLKGEVGLLCDWHTVMAFVLLEGIEPYF